MVGRRQLAEGRDDGDELEGDIRVGQQEIVACVRHAQELWGKRARVKGMGREGKEQIS